MLTFVQWRMVIVFELGLCHLNTSFLLLCVFSLHPFLQMFTFLDRFSPQPGSSVELSPSGYQFLTDLFKKYDKVGGCFRPGLWAWCMVFESGLKMSVCLPNAGWRPSSFTSRTRGWLTGFVYLRMCNRLCSSWARSSLHTVLYIVKRFSYHRGSGN